MFIGLKPLATLSASLLAASLPIVLAVLTPGLDRLADIPPIARAELADRLDRFDQLPASEQRAIRELDEALARLDPREGQRYFDLLRRYGAWVRGLDEDSRRQLESASIDERFAMIRDRLGLAGVPDSPGLDLALWLRSDTFNPIPLYDSVALIRVWASLDDQDRRRVESARSLDETVATLRRIGTDRGIDPAPEVRGRFRTVLDTILVEQGRLGQRGPRLVPEVADVNAWLLDAIKLGDGRLGQGSGNFPRRPGPSGEPPEALRPVASRLASTRLALLRLAEIDFLRDLRAQSDATSPPELASFEARLPDWYRATLDPLPPEVIRLRLRGLRQLALSDPELERWLSSAVPAQPGATSKTPGNRPTMVTPF